MSYYAGNQGCFGKAQRDLHLYSCKSDLQIPTGWCLLCSDFQAALFSEMDCVDGETIRKSIWWYWRGVYEKEFELHQADFGSLRCVVAICAWENEASEEYVRQERDSSLHEWKVEEMAALMPDFYAGKFKKSYNAAPWAKAKNWKFEKFYQHTLNFTFVFEIWNL